LTERLLYAAGVIDRIGRVDRGDTHTDSLALERRRGITIRSAVVSFVVDGLTINLIDTPGHPDFIAEVERVLHVLDGVVLVVSAVEGVQAQTRVLMRTLQRLRIPTLLFVNKIDRPGARSDRLLQAIAEKLSPAIVAMGRVDGLGGGDARYRPYGGDDPAFVSALVDRLAIHDDDLMAAYVDDEASVTYARLHRELAAQSKRARIHPVLFGSAMTGAGIDALIVALTELLPASCGDADAPVSGAVFKVDRGPSGEKAAYLRMFSGTIRVRDRLAFGRDRAGKVTAIDLFERGSTVKRSALVAGQIGRLSGLADVRIGDTVGASTGVSAAHHFAPPTLETAIVARHPADGAAVHSALGQLAEQDPLIDLRQDDERQELFVSLYGEVQREVIQATLADEYGLDVEFRTTTPICIERPVGAGSALEILGESSNPFLATVGLRVEPGAGNSGIEFRLEVDVRTIPLHIYGAVESFHEALGSAVEAALNQGLYGWQVTDCRVTLTHSGFVSPASTAGDFRKLLPLVLMEALRGAGTQVCEPLHRFELEIPADTVGSVLGALARADAELRAQEVRGAVCLLRGEIPVARTHAFQQILPGLTRGEGVLESAFARYGAVRGDAPTRPRADPDPLDRRRYLRRVLGWSGVKGAGG
jgi:ribosomal protection tetracycline resistance protein